jgi:hypothetical protein
MLDYANTIDAYDFPAFQPNTLPTDYRASKYVQNIKSQLDSLNVYLSQAEKIDLTTTQLTQYENPKFILSQIAEIKTLWSGGNGFIGFWEVLETLFLLYGYAYRVELWSKDIALIYAALREILRNAHAARKNHRFNWFRLTLKLMEWRNHYSHNSLTEFFDNDCISSDFYDEKDIASFGSKAYSNFVFDQAVHESLEWKRQQITGPKLLGLPVGWLGSKIRTKWLKTKQGVVAWESVLSNCLPLNVTLDIWEFMLRKENRMWPFSFKHALQFDSYEMPKCDKAVFQKALQLISKIEGQSAQVESSVEVWAKYPARVTIPTKALCETIADTLGKSDTLAALASRIAEEYNEFFLLDLTTLVIKKNFGDAAAGANSVKLGGFAPMICNKLF